MTALNRLLAPGSDRAAERWREDYAIAGREGLELHHLYRTMAWLGEPLADRAGATPFSPRRTKDRIEDIAGANQPPVLSFGFAYRPVTDDYKSLHFAYRLVTARS